MVGKARVQKRLYYKIGEACKALGIQPYVLRYWETEFPALAPSKSRSGQRVYNEKEIGIIRRIKELLYDEMFTIAGAKKKLQGELREPAKLKIVHPESQPTAVKDNENTPGLFDDDELELDELSLDLDQTSHTPLELNSDQRQAFRLLASHLLELRQLLRRPAGNKDQS